MNPQITLTGDWKMMNMAKLGIVLQAAKPLGNTGNPMNTGLRAIHYAYFRIRQGGTVRGIVSRLTYLRLAVSPSFGLSRLVSPRAAGTVLVIPYLLDMVVHSQGWKNHLQRLTGWGFQPLKTPENNCSGFYAKNSQKRPKIQQFAQVLENSSVLRIQGQNPQGFAQNLGITASGFASLGRLS